MRRFGRQFLGVFLCFSMLLCAIDTFSVVGYAIESGRPMIGIGENFMVVLDNDGNAYAWGDNTCGTLGNGTTASTDRAVDVSMPSGRRFSEVAVGRNHTLALADNGAVYAWGANTHGQCGGAEREDVLVPAAVAFSESVKIVSVAAGDGFSLALSEDGKVFAWGDNSLLQLGQTLEGEQTESGAPKKIEALDALFVTKIFAGFSSASAISSDGEVCLWGENASYQLGNDASKSAQLPKVLTVSGVSNDVVSVAHGDGYTAFLKSDGSILSCGKNGYGQFGNGEAVNNASMVLKPSLLDGVRFYAIGASNAQTVAMTANGAVYAAGRQLGSEDAPQTSFSKLSLPSATFAISIASGYENAAVILNNGTVLTWGANASGQLGSGATAASATPVHVLCDENALLLDLIPQGGGETASGHSATVSATVNIPSPTYAISIPSNIDLGNLTRTNESDPARVKRTSFAITASGIANLPENHAVTVTVTPPRGGFVLRNEEGTALPYGVYQGADASYALESGDAIAQFVEDGERNAEIRVDQSQITQSGHYEGVLNFAFFVEEISD